MADNLKHSSVGPELTQDEFESGTLHTIGGVPAGIVIDNKVDKVSGKGLSTEDYTTAEKEKLEAIEESSVSLTTVKADTDIASAISLKHAAVTVSAPIALSGQALSLVNNAGSPATITTISTDGTLAGNSDVYIPTQKAVKTYADSLCILRGTVTLANARLSLVDGTAFFDFGVASLMTSLLGCKLTITDSSGKNITGYIKAAGTGATFGPELVTNGNMETGDPPSNWTTSTGATLSSVADERTGGAGSKSLNAVRGTSNFVAKQVISGLTVGQLLVVSGWRKNIDASPGISIGVGDVAFGVSYSTSTSWNQQTIYYCTPATSHNLYVFVAGEGKQGRFDDLSAKVQTAPSATGVTIVSTPGGTTYNWASIESGFNYNDASGYTYYLSPSTF